MDNVTAVVVHLFASVELGWICETPRVSGESDEDDQYQKCLYTQYPKMTLNNTLVEATSFRLPEENGLGTIWKHELHIIMNDN